MHVHLTNETSWDPSDDALSKLEDALRNNIAPVRREDIGQVPELHYVTAYNASPNSSRQHSSFISNYDVPYEGDFDARSVAAVGTIQEIESLRSSAALDIDSYAAYLSDGRFVAASYTSKKKSLITPEDIARRWKCGLDAAKRTLNVTTQLAVRDTTNVSGDKRLSPYANLLRY